MRSFFILPSSIKDDRYIFFIPSSTEDGAGGGSGDGDDVDIDCDNDAW